jgi:hypothetical protein
MFTSVVLSAPSKGPVVLTGRREVSVTPTYRLRVSSILREFIGSLIVSAITDVDMVHALLAYSPKYKWSQIPS